MQEVVLAIVQFFFDFVFKKASNVKFRHVLGFSLKYYKLYGWGKLLV